MSHQIGRQILVRRRFLAARRAQTHFYIFLFAIFAMKKVQAKFKAFNNSLNLQLLRSFDKMLKRQIL